MIRTNFQELMEANGPKTDRITSLEQKIAELQIENQKPNFEFTKTIEMLDRFEKLSELMFDMNEESPTKSHSEGNDKKPALYT